MFKDVKSNYTERQLIYATSVGVLVVYLLFVFVYFQYPVNELAFLIVTLVFSIIVSAIMLNTSLVNRSS